MNITTLKRVLPFLIEGRITPWIWGYHGKGKSESIESWCRELGYLCFNFRLNTQCDVGDFLGLQDFVKDAKGQSIATRFCMPDWLKQAFDFTDKNPDKWAIIFVDEVNRAATKDLLGPLFQMSLDFKLHTYDFSDRKIALINASNPPTEDYSGVLSLDDKALLGRFCHLNFNPDKKEYFSYLKSKNIDVDVIDFLREQPDFIEEKDLAKFSVADYAKPDRRKWVRGVSKLKQLGLSKDDFGEVFAGLVGIEATVAFEKFLQRADKPLTVEDILNDYDSHRKKVAQYAKTDMRTDILNTACSKIIEYFQTNPDFTDDQGKNVVKFIEDLPNDLMFNVMHGVYNKRKFHDFCERNYDNIMKGIEARLEKIRETVDPLKD